MAGKLGTVAPENENCSKADQSLESLQDYEIHICSFQANMTLPVQSVQVFPPGVWRQAFLEVHDKPHIFHSSYH